MLDSIHELIEKNHKDIRESKRERNLSILKSAGFAALFAAGLVWHEEAIDGIDAFQNTEIPITQINETGLNVLIGVTAPLGLLEIGNAGIAQYSIRQIRRRQDSLNELVDQWIKIEETLITDNEAAQDTIVSENRDKPN